MTVTKIIFPRCQNFTITALTIHYRNSLFDYLAFFTLEWKYSFDFYYEIADALSYMKRRHIKNVRNWIALFSAPLVMYSDLLLSHPGVALFEGIVVCAIYVAMQQKLRFNSFLLVL